MPRSPEAEKATAQFCDVFKCYISAIVLGMNDALVEITGALAGFTMALNNNSVIAIAGLITGVAATLSMAASEFLSQEAASKKDNKSWDAAICTGIAYMLTVAILLLPFFICAEPYPAMGLCLFFAAIIILCFTYTESRINHTNFPHTFFRMVTISFTVAAISFGMSWCAKVWWGIKV